MFDRYKFNIITIQNSMSLQTDIQDNTFIKAAYKQGYSMQDIQPVKMQNIYHSSLQAIKNMSQAQKKYYLQKKYAAIQLRRTKIIQKIKQQIKKDKNQSQHKRGFNPVIKKLLQEHQMRLQKKARYQQRVRISKTRQNAPRKISNTIDFGRTSPNFSQSDRNSRISKQSIKSQKSNVSSISNSSHRQRLQLVRLKQKQAQRYKKSLLAHHQDQSRKKIDKVHQSRLSASRRIKTKSQISQQAVQERKQQLQNLRRDQIRQHIQVNNIPYPQKLKYKMMKNQYIKKKHEQKKVNKSIPYDSLYKKQLKNMFEQNQKQQHKARYEQKLKTLYKNKRQIQQQKRIQAKQRSREKKLKQLHVIKYKQHMIFQEEQKKRQTLYYETNNLQRAKNKKLEIQSEKKMRLIDNKVKQEIARSNYNSIQNRRKIESQNQARYIDQKMQEINDIEDIKRRLTGQRNRYSMQRNKVSDKIFSFY